MSTSLHFVTRHRPQFSPLEGEKLFWFQLYLRCQTTLDSSWRGHGQKLRKTNNRHGNKQIKKTEQIYDKLLDWCFIAHQHK